MMGSSSMDLTVSLAIHLMGAGRAADCRDYYTQLGRVAPILAEPDTKSNKRGRRKAVDEDEEMEEEMEDEMEDEMDEEIEEDEIDDDDDDEEEDDDDEEEGEDEEDKEDDEDEDEWGIRKQKEMPTLVLTDTLHVRGLLPGYCVAATTREGFSAVLLRRRKIKAVCFEYIDELTEELAVTMQFGPGYRKGT